MSTQSSKRLPGPLGASLGLFLLLVPMLAIPLLAADSATRPSTPRIIWRTSIGKVADAPAAADAKHIVAASGNELVVLSSSDGKALARTRGMVLSSQPLLLANGEFYAGHESGAAFHFDDALPQWMFKIDGKVVGRPALAGDRLLVGSYDTNVYCLSANHARELWRFKTAAQVHAAPLVAGDLVIVGGCDGHLHALDLATGQEKWSVDAGGPIAATPALHDGRILFASMSGSISSIDTTGKVVWQVSPLKEQSPFTASPAISPDRVAFAADDGQLVILSPADGKLLAQGKLPGKPTAALIFYNDLLFAGVDDGRIYLIDPATGKQTSRITLGGDPLSLIPIDQGLITNTTDGTVWLLK